MSWSVVQADCLDWLASLPERSASLTLFSPPYEQARLYLENGEDMGIARDTEEWVAWMVQVFRACLRVTDGLVACVCEGQTRSYRYSCGPALLMADLHRAGVHLRKPPIYRRVGIPGSGGPDWLRNDYEWIVCATNGGKLPWSDNTACGHPPKWAPGGEISHRKRDGRRVNSRREMQDGIAPKVAAALQNGFSPGEKLHTKHNGKNMRVQVYTPPEKANPGNVIECTVGGGQIGNELAHENEAPFPEALARFFVLSFCPPGGLVIDPTCGSGTTGAVAVREGRNFLGCDLRQSQIELSRRRIEGETPTMFPGG